MHTSGDGGPVRWAGDATALSALSAGLRRSTDASSVLAATVAALDEALGVDEGTIWSGEPEEMVVDAAVPAEPARAGGLAALAAEAARSGEIALGDDAIAAPLVALGQPLGVLVLTTATPGALANGATPLIESVAVQAAAALESTRRFHEVMALERLKRDFINRVSHELRTPITIISGFLSTLLAHEDAVDPSQQRYMIERSLAASDRLASLIEDLLVLSRLEAGVLTPAVVPLRVVALAREALEGVPPSDHDLASAVTIDIAATLEATVDPEMTTRALTFIIDNALKYAGDATVTAGAGDAGDVIVDVRDHGPGIAPDVRATLFEMFTRGPGTTDVPGLGVGLPVARTLLEVIGGSIEVLDPPSGTGALVRLHLPR